MVWLQANSTGSYNSSCSQAAMVVVIVGCGELLLYWEQPMPMEEQHLETEALESTTQLPVAESKRTCTDLCCLITSLSYTALLVITSAVIFDSGTFARLNFPADSDGSLCGHDHPHHQYLYFSGAPSITQRVCVSRCPTRGDTSLACQPNSAVASCAFSPQNRYYRSDPQETRLGFFCFPTDRVAREQLKLSARLNHQESVLSSVDSLYLSLIVAAGLSLLFFISVQCAASLVNYAIVGVAMVSALSAAIVLLTTDAADSLLKTLLAVTFVLVLVLIGLSLIRNMQSLKMHAIFLRFATQVVADEWLMVLFIPLYLLLLVALVVVTALQLTAVWSSAPTAFDASASLYHHSLSSPSAVLLTTLVGIQLIWGAGFLKESFNYCVSGNGVSFYFKEVEEARFGEGAFYPLWLQLSKNTGTVIACAFMTSFFSLFDLFFDMVKPTNQHSACGRCFWGVFGCCQSLWDLVRSDAMAFVCVTGNPFCNSARYCEYLCGKSLMTDYAQSCSRIYRIAAHFSIVSLTAIFYRLISPSFSVYALSLVIFMSLVVSTFFVSMHADSAEALQILYLLDQQLMHRHRRVKQHQQDGLGEATYRREIAEAIREGYQQLHAPEGQQL